MNIKKKKIDKKYVVAVVVLGIVLLVLGIMIITRAAGCGKNGNVPVFTYLELEEQEDAVTITGLTEKGRSDETIVVPSSIDGKKVVSISREAFRDAENLKSVTIEEGVEQIGENAFFNCKKLESLTIPASVSYIGTNAIKNTKWESDWLLKSDYIIVNGILTEVKVGKSSYEIPDGVKTIGSGVFYNNKTVVSVKMPQSVELVGDYAFAGCVLLEEIKLPANLKEIGYSAFNGCELLEIEVPSTVQKVGIDAFLGVKEKK
ncbi:MAG: leucine-rich repeat protein [Lachnospira sp.]|nr:leucine-rich repeat protein [Lachnospira sp.]